MLAGSSDAEFSIKNFPQQRKEVARGLGIGETVEKAKVYLDMCCFNRPYDDQTQPRIQFEAAAKLMIQALIVDDQINLVWSYVLDFENSKNPFPEKREAILAFKGFAHEIVVPGQEIEKVARGLQSKGLKAYDSLHVACAIFAGCDYFLTVDDRVLNRQIEDIVVTDPVDFINQLLKEGRVP